MPDHAKTMAVLDVLAECRAAASTLEQRAKYDELASAIITTEIGSPMVMADSLARYTRLSQPGPISTHAKAILGRLHQEAA